MNEDKYSSAKEIIKGLNIWIDDKHLLESVVSRAERLEKEVLNKQKSLDEQAKEISRISIDYDNLYKEAMLSSENYQLWEKEMKEENQRLQKALNFYADHFNWLGVCIASSRINCDGGDIARRALERDESE